MSAYRVNLVKQTLANLCVLRDLAFQIPERSEEGIEVLRYEEEIIEQNYPAKRDFACFTQALRGE